jgi:hypothetical protein
MRADRRARAAVGLHSCKEDWVHAAVDASRHRDGGRAAADQLGSLDVVATLPIADRGRNVGQLWRSVRGALDYARSPLALA